MGELRLYAIGIAEVRELFGARPEVAERARQVAQAAFAPPEPDPVTRRLRRLGPLFRRPPAAPVISPHQPEPRDLDTLLAGAHVPPDRLVATWRLLEALVAGLAWGSTRVGLSERQIDELDYALAGVGVTCAMGLRHLLTCNPELTITPVSGLALGWHPYAAAVAMRDTYRHAAPALSPESRALTEALAGWLDGYGPWSEIAGRLGRPVPDLIGCYAA